MEAGVDREALRSRYRAARQHLMAQQLRVHELIGSGPCREPFDSLMAAIEEMRLAQAAIFEETVTWLTRRIDALDTRCAAIRQLGRELHEVDPSAVPLVERHPGLDDFDLEGRSPADLQLGPPLRPIAQTPPRSDAL